MDRGAWRAVVHGVAVGHDEATWQPQDEWPSGLETRDISTVCSDHTAALRPAPPPGLRLPHRALTYPLFPTLTLKETGCLQWVPRGVLSAPFSLAVTSALRDTRPNPWLSKSELSYLPAKFPTVLRTGLGVGFYL